jgi:hypothetical protein
VIAEIIRHKISSLSDPVRAEINRKFSYLAGSQVEPAWRWRFLIPMKSEISSQIRGWR